MKCPKCGYPLPEDSLFCQYCGAELESQPVSDHTAEEVEELKIIPTAAPVVSELVPEPLSEPVPEFVSEHMSEPEPESRTKATQEEVQAEQYEALKTRSEVFTMPQEEPVEHTVATPVVTGDQKKSKQRYCKLCGQPIDSVTKKCTGCGKQYFKARFRPVYAILILLVLLCGYVGFNYFSAVAAMNNQEFIKSQQFFDNLFVSETVFPDKYAYVEAGVLMEEGKYIEALNAFNKVENTPVPASITDLLKSEIYSDGQAAYKAGSMTEAKKNFNAISTYKRSEDYLLLISCDGSGFASWTTAKNNYNKLIKLLGFENTDEIILKYESVAELFLEGRWEDGNTNPYYFEMYENDEGTLSCRYNLPRKNSSGYYYISKGIYSVGETESSAVKYYKFSIIDEDTMSVYCYKDGSTHKLYRQ